MNLIKPFSLLVYVLFIGLGTASLHSCIEGKSQQASQVTLPVLLDRNPAIGSAEEQERYQQTYMTLMNRLWKTPEEVDARLRMVQLYMLEARATGEHGYYYPAALQVLNEINTLKPTQAETFQALSLKASVQLSLHNFRQALETANQAVALNPHNAQIYGALIDAHVELGEYDKAVEMADKMISIRPDLRSYSRISYLREIHGKVEGALEAMRMAVAAAYPGYEESAWCRLTLGNLYKTYGDLQNAEFQYKTILMERPGYPFATAALAELEQEKGNYEAAEKLLKEACAVIPEVGFYQQLASLYLETGRDEEAMQIREQVLEMLADDEAHGHKMSMEYAAVYRDLFGNYEKALEYAMLEYAVRPENIQVNRLLASIYLKMDKPEVARTHLEKASRTDSKDPELSELMAQL